LKSEDPAGEGVGLKGTRAIETRLDGRFLVTSVKPHRQKAFYGLKLFIFGIKLQYISGGREVKK
jgi:hypothetical protein